MGGKVVWLVRLAASWRQSSGEAIFAERVSYRCFTEWDKCFIGVYHDEAMEDIYPIEIAAVLVRH